MNIVVKFGSAILFFLVAMLFWFSKSVGIFLGFSGWGRFFSGLLALIVMTLILIFGGD